LDEIRAILWRYYLQRLSSPNTLGEDKKNLFEDLERRGFAAEYDLLLTWDAVTMGEKAPPLHIDLTNATLSGSNVSVQLNSIGSSLTALSHSAEAQAITAALQSLTETIQANRELSQGQQAKLLENLSFIAKEAELPKAQRHLSLLDHVLTTTPHILSVASGLTEAWIKFGPQITGFFLL
jgi:hypothetical protein